MTSFISASVSGRRRCLSSRLGTMLANGLNFNRPSLIARLQAAVNQLETVGHFAMAKIKEAVLTVTRS